MNRFTRTRDDGLVFLPNSGQLKSAIKKLSEYENLGYSPEELAKMISENKKLRNQNKVHMSVIMPKWD